MEETPRPLSAFNMAEIYRIARNESIPGFVLLASEQQYINEYRQAIIAEEKKHENLEQTKIIVEESNEAPKRKYTRRKKVEEDPEEINDQEPLESE